MARLRLTLLVGLLALPACQIPPDVLALPRYVHDFFTNPNFVVNAPLRHEMLGTAAGTPDAATRDARFRLPPGFALDVFASGIPHPRYMRITSRGDVIVTQPRKQKVLLLRDADGDGRADETRVLLDDLHLPHGVELVGDTLFVAGPAYVVRAKFDVEAGRVVGEPEPFVALPDIGGHSWRPLRLGPDRKLYTAIGAACNVCEPTADRDQSILRFDLATGTEEVVATGFRNAAHFDWQPGTGAMFATEVGVDYLGEDVPLEELNRIEVGGFYGFPYLHGPDARDPELSPSDDDAIARAVAPAHTFIAHTTPLGMTFLRGKALPDDYRGAALVALKGSWNRDRMSGYKVVSLHWSTDPDGTESIAQRDFLIGFERDEDVVGRPVDVVVGPDGAIYVSDDMAGAIYRITRDESAIGNTFAIHAHRGGETLSRSNSRDTLVATSERAALHEEGARLFDRHGCATCHRASATREAPVPLELTARGRDAAHVIDVLRAPPPSMPRPLLTDAERDALAAYLIDPS